MKIYNQHSQHGAAKLLKLTFMIYIFESIYDPFFVLSACGIRKKENK